MALDYGAPYYQIHRAHYHTLLLRLARAAPDVHIRLGATVSDVQPDPAVGPRPPSDLGASKRPASALGRFVPPNACALSSMGISILA